MRKRFKTLYKMHQRRYVMKKSKALPILTEIFFFKWCITKAKKNFGTNAESEPTTFTGGEKFWIRIRHNLLRIRMGIFLCFKITTGMLLKLIVQSLLFQETASNHH
jgi:hypothetical protein